MSLLNLTLFSFWSQPLNILIFLPLLGALIASFTKGEKKLRMVMIGTSAVTFLYSLQVWRLFSLEPAQKFIAELGESFADPFGFKLGYLAPWFPEIGMGNGPGVSWYLGIDGISLSLIVLTTFVSISAAISSNSIKERLQLYVILFLLLETSLLGVLVARDFFMFFVCWEWMLLPMYCLIGIWGGKNRIYAAIKLFLYTLAGSVAVLIGILIMFWASPVRSFGISELTTFFANNVPVTGPGLVTQTSLFLLFFIGFGIKVPIVPFHTWLPDAHVQAPTPISMMLAAVLLKMGTYGFIRILLPATNGAIHDTNGIAVPIMAIVGVVSMIYAALAAMAQKDWKSMVAYSSISHMGYLIFAFSTASEIGLSAGMFIMISHGLISACMFHLVGVVYERTHNRDLLAYGGLGSIVPTYFTIWIFVGMANLGLPGLSGFWGEFMAFVAAFSKFDWIVSSGIFEGMNFFRVLAGFGVVTIVITAAYMLLMIQRIFMGPLNEKWKDLKDMKKWEVWAIAPVMFFILYYGLNPKALVDIYGESTARLAESLGYLTSIIP